MLNYFMFSTYTFYVVSRVSLAECLYVECHYDKCRYAESLNAECHEAGYCGVALC